VRLRQAFDSVVDLIDGWIEAFALQLSSTDRMKRVPQILDVAHIQLEWVRRSAIWQASAERLQ
jgi:hypothetical protein